MPASPGERRLQAQLAASTRWSREDPHDPAGPLPRARAKFNQRFFDQVDPDGVLPLEERERRAGAARKAYFQKLALKSARARRYRKSTAPRSTVDGDS